MSETFTLSELENETLDYIIGMPLPVKRDYFHKLVESFYPKSINSQEEYESLMESYMASFYVEKLYRSNRFFKNGFVQIIIVIVFSIELRMIWLLG